MHVQHQFGSGHVDAGRNGDARIFVERSRVEHDRGTPSVSAKELDAMMHDGTKLVVLDSRPFDE